MITKTDGELVMAPTPMEGELMPRGVLVDSRTTSGELVGLNDNEIKRLAPAVFGRQHSSLSDAYAFVKTGRIVQMLREVGFAVQSVKQTNPRKRDASTVRHMVTMCMAEDLGKQGKDKIDRPTVMLLNSNNGRSKFRFLFGRFRLACSNGLIIGEVESSAALIHRAGEIGQLDGIVKEITDRQLRANSVIDKWRAINLATGAQHRLAHAMAKLRFGGTADKYDLESALRVRRPADEGDDLWTVFNRLQEAYVRGGVAFMGNHGDARVSRAIDGVVADTGFNLAAWQAAEAMAREMSSGNVADVVVN